MQSIEEDPEKASRSKLLVNSTVFAPKSLCRCSDGFVGRGTECRTCTGGNDTGNGCCTCPVGSARLESKSQNKTETTCLKCFSKAGCKNDTCGDGCSFGYEGTLCSECSPGFFSFLGNCHACPNKNTKGTAQFAVLACEGVGILIAILGLLWYFVPASTAADTEERGGRKAELLEQTLLLLSYWQVLGMVGAVREREDSEGSWQEIIQLRFGSLVEMFSVQCLFGYQTGRHIEVLATVFALPSLCGLAFVAGCCRGNPFLGLKRLCGIGVECGRCSASSPLAAAQGSPLWSRPCCSSAPSRPRGSVSNLP